MKKTKRLYATVLRVWPCRTDWWMDWKVWSRPELAAVNAIRQEGPAVIKWDGKQLWVPLIYGME